MMTLKRKKRILIFVFLFGLLSFIGLRYWPSDFDTKIECISYRFGDATYENVVVRLVGSKNVSLFLEDYISYVIYIDDIRYPKENHLLMPHRIFGSNKISGNGTNYKKTSLLLMRYKRPIVLMKLFLMFLSPTDFGRTMLVLQNVDISV